jgi:hypothetical protein
VAEPDELPALPLDVDRIVAVLAAHRVEYVLVGGTALLIYGIGSRETYDVDIVPSTSLHNLERLGAALRELEAKVITAWLPETSELHVDESSFEPQLFVDNPFLRALTPAGRLDVLLKPAGVPRGFEELAPGAVAAVKGEVEVALSAIVDLIRMKEAGGRPKDSEDLRGLYAYRGDAQGR